MIFARIVDLAHTMNNNITSGRLVVGYTVSYIYQKLVESLMSVGYSDKEIELGMPGSAFLEISYTFNPDISEYVTLGIADRVIVNNLVCAYCAMLVRKLGESQAFWDTLIDLEFILICYVVSPARTIVVENFPWSYCQEKSASVFRIQLDVQAYADLCIPVVRTGYDALKIVVPQTEGYEMRETTLALLGAIREPYEFLVIGEDHPKAHYLIRKSKQLVAARDFKSLQLLPYSLAGTLLYQ